MHQYKTSSLNRVLFVVLWLINPLIALYIGIKNHNKISIVLTLVMFCAFYGTTIKLYEKDKDSSQYRDNFYQMYDQNITFNNFKESIFDGETTFDVALPIISYTIALATRNEQILFLVFGAIFGLFYGKNLQFLFNLCEPIQKRNYLTIILLLTFMLIVPFWSGLNGIRMWTAAHIFFYGASRLISSNDKRSYLYILLAVLFHFSFVILALILTGFRFLPLKKYIIIYFTLFVFSFLVAETATEQLVTIVRNYSPEFIQAKSEAYTKDVYVETFQNKEKNYTWHAQIYQYVLKYSIVFLLILTFIHRSKIKNETIIYFLTFALIIFSFANIFSLLPSGARFYKIAYLFSLIPILYSSYNGHINKLAKYTVIPLLFWMVINIREGFDLISLGTIISNPILTFTSVANDIPLIDFIK